jgi:hypothetical protein
VQIYIHDKQKAISEKAERARGALDIPLDPMQKPVMLLAEFTEKRTKINDHKRDVRA